MGLEHFDRLTNLKKLDLSCTQVTDAGLEHLRGMRGLERLSLYDTNVTDEGAAKLKRALPNCLIAR